MQMQIWTFVIRGRAALWRRKMHVKGKRATLHDYADDGRSTPKKVSKKLGPPSWHVLERQS
jgi:hypothetical protein